MINCGTRRPIVRSIVGFNDRSHDQSLLPTTDRAINRGTRWPIVRPIVAPDHRSYDQWWHPTTDRTINRSIVRPIVRSIGRLPIRDHPQLVVPPCTTGGTITTSDLSATAYDFESLVRSFEYDHRPCCD